MAKISTQQGLENFDEILIAADAILLDRDSIATEVGCEKLFLVEKIITAKCIRVTIIFINSLCLYFNLNCLALLNYVLQQEEDVFLKVIQYIHGC